MTEFEKLFLVFILGGYAALSPFVLCALAGYIMEKFRK